MATVDVKGLTTNDSVLIWQLTSLNAERAIGIPKWSVLLLHI